MNKLKLGITRRGYLILVTCTVQEYDELKESYSDLPIPFCVICEGDRPQDTELTKSTRTAAVTDKMNILAQLQKQKDEARARGEKERIRKQQEEKAERQRQEEAAAAVAAAERARAEPLPQDHRAHAQMGRADDAAA